MKQVKFLFPLLACAFLLLVSACSERPSAGLERMQGDWVSVKGSPHFSLLEENGQYKVTRTVTVRGKERTDTYTIRETDGCLYIDTGFAVVLTSDKRTDRITLSPGGEFQRSNKQLKK